MLDLPEPFGPTTQVMPGSRRRVVAEANDLNPRSVRLFRYTDPLLRSTHLTVPRRAKPGTAADGRRFPASQRETPTAGNQEDGTATEDTPWPTG